MSKILKPASILTLLLLFLAGLYGCKEAPEEPPMPEQKMQQILLDMHLAETYSQGLGDSTRNRFEKNYDSLAVFYKSILRHHRVSFEEFNKTLDWYRERPAEMDSLYTRVLNQLMELKAKEGLNDIDEKKTSSVSVPDTAKSKPDTAQKPVFMKRDTAGG